MKNRLLLLIIAIFLIFVSCKKTRTGIVEENPLEEEIEALINTMTMDQKIGQLNLIIGNVDPTGPSAKIETTKFESLIRQGKITGLFNTYGAKAIKKLQQIAVEESDLKIPLLFGADIIHGFRTILPIPLAEAATWDLEKIEKSARIAAMEASAVGINWNFAPMVDITRDPRWGRIAEGAGEDPYLGSKIARARVRGFQGDSLSDPTTIAACVKHFAAYGAAEAGREYNRVDISYKELEDIYLPPFKASLEEGAATIMTSFNDIFSIPATANKILLKDILRRKLGFNGVVVSDWQSITEMINHGYAKDTMDAAEKSITSSVDIDMMSDAYIKYLKELYVTNIISMEHIDAAVRRVLTLKHNLGLFKNPYLYSDSKREEEVVFSNQNRKDALDIAKRCIVLLKNKNNVLPLRKDH